MLGKKKIIGILIAAVVVISVCTVGLWYSALSSKKVEIESIAVYTESGDEGINIKVITIPKEQGFSGNAELKITHEYDIYQDSVKITDGEGSVNILYNKFVTENGGYIVEATFKGVTGNTSYPVEWVVESIDVVAEPVPPEEETKISITVYPDRMPLSANVAVTIPEINVVNTSLAETAGYYTGKFSYSNSGNYTVEATLTNNYVKEGGNISSSPLTFFINQKPIANAGDDKEVHLSVNKTVHLDASSSYSTDDSIVNYTWCFDTDNDGDGHNDTRYDIEVDYEYDSDDAQPGGKTHIVTLFVRDVWDDISIDSCTVTVYHR